MLLICHPERGLSFAPQARRTTAVEGPLHATLYLFIAMRSPSAVEELYL
jgi:hypothetical protein